MRVGVSKLSIEPGLQSWGIKLWDPTKGRLTCCFRLLYFWTWNLVSRVRTSVANTVAGNLFFRHRIKQIQSISTHIFWGIYIWAYDSGWKYCCCSVEQNTNGRSAAAPIETFALFPQHCSLGGEKHDATGLQDSLVKSHTDENTHKTRSIISVSLTDTITPLNTPSWQCLANLLQWI